MKILALDEGGAATQTLARALENLGHTVHVATANESVWQSLDGRTFDLVLSDVARLAAMQRQLQERDDTLSDLHEGITRHNAELQRTVGFLHTAQQRYVDLFQNLPAACFACDRMGILHEWNASAERMFGHALCDALGKPLWEIFAEEIPEAQSQLIQREKQHLCRVFAGEALFDVERERVQRSGQRLYVVENTFPVRHADGSIIGAVSVCIDITARKHLEAQVQAQLHHAHEMNARLEAVNGNLQEMVTLDGLTGLKNHRHFRESLASAVNYARRYGEPLSLVMLDVDHFKAFNDAFGHPAGDEALQIVADLLRAHSRSHDLFARYGGEEFAALLPKTDTVGARAMTERLRQAIAHHAWQRRPLTASFGIAIFDQTMPGPDTLLEQADKALYFSKTRGRDCITHYLDLSSPHSQAA